MEGVLAGNAFGSNILGGKYGRNSLFLPAFSYLSEGATTAIRTANPRERWNWGESASPGLNEIFTYLPELSNYTWANGCNTRSLHYRSPLLLARSTDKLGNPMLVSVGAPGARWETPDEYATRWVDGLARAVRGLVNLQMPFGIPAKVDVTECYVSNGDLGLINYYPDYSFAGKSLAQVREDFRQAPHRKDSFNQSPPKRIDVLRAIRAKLMERDIPELGRIFWWVAYSPEPRSQTGLSASYGLPQAGNPVTRYDPDLDFKFTNAELRALIPNMAP
jgi:hypothetical protein